MKKIIITQRSSEKEISIIDYDALYYTRVTPELKKWILIFFINGYTKGFEGGVYETEAQAIEKALEISKHFEQSDEPFDMSK